jgi:hypothetical protein
MPIGANNGDSQTQDVMSRISALESSLATVIDSLNRIQLISPVHASSSASNTAAANANPPTTTANIDPFIEGSRATPHSQRVSAHHVNPEGDFSVASATTGASQLVTTSGSKIRHKIEDFPTYNGAKEIGSDIIFWIAVIESKTKSFADKFHDDDYRHIILGRLTGPAKDQLEYTSFLFDRCQNWQEMKSNLKQSFEDPSYRLKLEHAFAMRVLSPFESSAAFMNAWYYLARAVMEQRHSHDPAARSRLVNDEVARLISSLPVSIQSDVESRF